MTGVPFGADRPDEHDDLDDTALSVRRTRLSEIDDLAVGPDADDLEQTELSARRRGADDVEPRPADDLDVTEISVRRAGAAGADGGADAADDDLDVTEIGSRRVRGADVTSEADEVDDLDDTVIGFRRAGVEAGVSGAASVEDDLEETAIGARRAVADTTPDDGAANAGDDDLESTLLGSRRRAESDIDDDTLLSARRAADAADDDTLLGSRRGGKPAERVDTGALETTKIAGLVEPPQSAAWRTTDPNAGRAPQVEESEDPDDTLRVAARRATTVDPDEVVEMRRAAVPQQAILKAPYRPREIPDQNVVRMADVPRAPQLPVDSALAAEQQRTSSRRGLVGIAIAFVVVGAAALTGIGLLVLSLLGG